MVPTGGASTHLSMRVSGAQRAPHRFCIEDRPVTLHPSAVVRRAIAAATAALIITGVLLPSATLAAAGAPPVARPDAINTLKNVATSGNVLTNDKNNGSGTLSVSGFGAISASV